MVDRQWTYTGGKRKVRRSRQHMEYSLTLQIHSYILDQRNRQYDCHPSRFPATSLNVASQLADRDCESQP